MKDSISDFNVDEMTRGTNVDTPMLLKLQADRCAVLGTKKNNLYSEAVTQLEILGLGSDLLGKSYDQDKKKLVDDTNKKINKLMLEYNYTTKNTNKNREILDETKNIKDQASKEVHKLLMIHLAPLFYQKEIIEVD